MTERLAATPGWRRSELLAEVRAGLARPQKELPPKYFYDEYGSELFERITGLPEYYLTRTERSLLEDRVRPWLLELRPRALVELGAGSAAKTRVLLDAMVEAGSGEIFVPIDVSAAYLEEAAQALREEYPALAVRAVVADFGAGLAALGDVPRPALYALLGSTIGNFEESAAVQVLRGIRRAMRRDDRFLMGADLRKEVARLEAAYNDGQGVTAEFNRNVLRVLNRELAADFDPDAFRHRAFYSRAAHRIEMHLVAVRPQQVHIPGIGAIGLREGESIRTEISCKYDRGSVAGLFAAAGLELEAWHTDAEGLYALAVGAPRS